MGVRVVAAVDDIFFAAKIRGTAEQSGAEIKFARDAEGAAAAARESPPDVVIADLNSSRCDPFALAVLFKSDEGLRRVPLVAFFSHVQTELRQRALDAGFDYVLPRSAFVARLPEILRVEL